MMPTEAMPGAMSGVGPTAIVGRVPTRPTIFAESVAISGEALLIGLVVLLVLAILGVLAIAALVYLGARVAADLRRRSTAGVPAGASRDHPPAPARGAGTEPDHRSATTDEVHPRDVIPAVPYDPTGRLHRAPRSSRSPLAVWLWVVCTVVAVGIVVAFPGVWYLGPLAAPLLGAAGAELTNLIDMRP